MRRFVEGVREAFNAKFRLFWYLSPGRGWPAISTCGPGINQDPVTVLYLCIGCHYGLQNAIQYSKAHGLDMPLTQCTCDKIRRPAGS